MRDSFEKKVQDKLDELNLTPSAPVWEKIEAQIKPDKKRRPGFFWVPFLLVLLGGLGWWLMKEQQKPEAVTINKTTTIPPENKGTAGRLTTDKEGEASIPKKGEEGFPGINPQASEATNAVLSEKNKTALTITGKGENVDGMGKPGPISRPGRQTVNKKDIDREENSILQTTDREKGLSQVLQEKIPNAAIKESAPVREEKIVVKVHDESRVDSTIHPAVADEKQPGAVANDSVAVKRKIAAIAKDWHFSVALQAGRSTPFNSWATTANFDAAPSQNSGGSGNLSNNAPYPNPVRRGSAYAIGASVARTISQRLQVSLGVQYSQWQTHTKVGSYKPLDTALAFQSRSVAVGGYYRSGYQQDYTNRFQLLEVPVSINYQLLRSLPFFVSAGAAYGRLLNSNALTYDRASMIYYENKEALSHNQFSVFSSLQYGIINNPSLRLTAGPVAQWQMTSFQQANGTARPRLFVAGIKTAIQF